MNKPKLLVMDDYEGELALSPAMARLRQLADVAILDHPINDYSILKDFQVILALRERTKLDSPFFEVCPSLELVLQTGGHAYHIDQVAASQRGIVIALGRRVSKPTVVVPELALGFVLGLVRQIYPLTLAMSKGELGIPYGKVDELAKRYMRGGEPIHEAGLLAFSDAQIIDVYQQRFRGVAGYYKFATDRNALRKLKSSWKFH